MIISALSSITLFIFLKSFALLLIQLKLCSVPCKLSHSAIALNMYMHRLMLSAEKEERETKKSKDLWHKTILLIVITPQN